MRAVPLFFVVVLIFIPAIASAGGSEWRRYAIPNNGASVEVPVWIFSRDDGPLTDGVGRRFLTDDSRADLTIQTVANPENESPATFLAKKHPPEGILYKKVTPDFFVVSSIRKDRIWYNRCNHGDYAMICVLINYPTDEKRIWDSVVSRISHSLSR
jgi:hypothetical protein